MSNYKFDENGRLLKRWWKCNQCGGSFFGYVEVCPSCGKDGEPGDTPEGDEPRLVRLNDTEYGLLFPYDIDSCTGSIFRIELTK